MSLRDVRFDILNIIDLNPSWIENLNYNPLEAIVKHGKSHHLLTFLEDVYGFRKDNPVMSEIRYFHYKSPYVDTIFKDLKLKSLGISKINSADMDIILDILTLLAKINHFKIYNKNHIDQLCKEINKSRLIDKVSILRVRAMFLYYMNKLGYENIFSDRSLKKIEEYQNSDGGWPAEALSEKKDSDVFTTLFIYRTFIMNNLWSAKPFLEKARSYLLLNHLNSEHSNEEMDKWNRIYSGYKKNNVFEGGTILLLESLILGKNNDLSKIKSISKWLKDLQFNDGFFPYHAKLKSEKNISSTIKILSLIKKSHLLK